MIILYEFKKDNSKYCLIKVDGNNFSIKEYLDTERIAKDRVVKFKNSSLYYGTLCEACNKIALYNGYSISKKCLNPKEDIKPCDVTDENKHIYIEKIFNLLNS